MRGYHRLGTTLIVWLMLLLPGQASPRRDRTLEVRGKAEVKLQGQAKFQPLKVWMKLGKNDVLRLRKQGKITLRCAKGHIRSWFKGQTVVSRLCPPEVVRRLESRGECDDPTRFLSLWRGLCLKPETTTLEPQQLLDLVQQIGIINAHDISRDAKLLLQAEVYIEQKQYNQVISTLQALVDAETQTPIVYRWLGDTYEYLGQVVLAQDQYQKALSFARTEGNHTEAGAAAYGLAKLTARQQNVDMAELWLQQAQTSFGVGQLQAQQNQMAELLQKVRVLKQRREGR